ncbi:MAG: DUF6122 family protein, partial [archaeon]
MITPIHIIFNLILFFSIDQIISANFLDLFFLLFAELIDLDHLFSKPIYHPKRNPFRKHFLHKNWRLVLVIALVFLFIR